MSYIKKEQQIDQHTDTTKITVVLEKQGKKNQWPIQMKMNVKLGRNGQVYLRDIILNLKQQNFNQLFDSSVSYYNSLNDLYVYCFFLPKTITQQQLKSNPKYAKAIPSSSLKQLSQIECKLKFRKKVRSKLELLKQQQKIKYSQTLQDDTKKGKQKEKSIAEVIEKVALWRKLYTGFQNEKGQVTHLELEKAAQQIGVVKKTLDDYLLQIRNGKRYGFNFHKQRNQKIGDLRSFVKGKRAKQ